MNANFQDLRDVVTLGFQMAMIETTKTMRDLISPVTSAEIGKRVHNSLALVSLSKHQHREGITPFLNRIRIADLLS